MLSVRLFFIVFVCLAVLSKGQSQEFISSTSALFYQKNYLGLSYQNYSQNGRAILFSFHDHDPRFGNMNFHTHLYDNPFEQIKEQFQSIHLSGNYYLNKRFAVGLNVPYNISIRHFEEDSPYRLQGIGDVTVQAKYHLHDSKLFKPKATVQHISTLTAFGKFKTGKYNITNHLNDIDPYLQAGTGSFDLAGNLQHQILFKRFNLNAAFQYNYKGVSYYQMKFGNQYAVNFTAEYAILHKKIIQLRAFSNLTYRQKQNDTLENKPIKRPNKYKEIYNKSGILAAYQNWTLQIETAIPLYVQYEDFSMRWKAATFVKIFFTLN